VDSSELQAALSEMVAAQVREVEKVVGWWAEARALGGERSLQELELQIREWALRVGQKCFERLVHGIAEGSPQDQGACPKCGGPVVSEGPRDAALHGSMGDVRFTRRYFGCATCKHGMCPLDAELGLDEKRNSPALQQMVSLAGSVGPFEKGSDLLRELGSIVISRHKVEQITEAVGERVEHWMNIRQQRAAVGLLKPEGAAVDRLYVEADGTTVPMHVKGGEAEAPTEGDSAAAQESRRRRSAHQRTEGKVEYREVKIGAVFEATVDEEGQPQAGLKTYTGTFGDADACVRQVQAEAKARGSDAAKEIVTLSDGGEWLWNRLPAAFPGKKVTQILDWYHAAERLSHLGNLTFGQGTEEAKAWTKLVLDLLYEGKTGDVLSSMETLRPKSGDAKDFLRQSLGYFRTHEQRMNYGELRAQGYFIGSGVIESSCKHVVAARLKQAGMKWSPEHVPKMLAVRVCRASGWWEGFWKTCGAAA
jgi:hypothetical protein